MYVSSTTIRTYIEIVNGSTVTEKKIHMVGGYMEDLVKLSKLVGEHLHGNGCIPGTIHYTTVNLP